MPIVEKGRDRSCALRSGPVTPRNKEQNPETTFFAHGGMSAAIPSGALCRPDLPGHVGAKEFYNFNLRVPPPTACYAV